LSELLHQPMKSIVGSVFLNYGPITIDLAKNCWKIYCTCPLASFCVLILLFYQPLTFDLQIGSLCQITYLTQLDINLSTYQRNKNTVV